MCACIAAEELGRAKLKPECTLTVLQLLTEDRIELPTRQVMVLHVQSATLYTTKLERACDMPLDVLESILLHFGPRSGMRLCALAT